MQDSNELTLLRDLCYVMEYPNNRQTCKIRHTPYQNWSRCLPLCFWLIAVPGIKFSINSVIMNYQVAIASFGIGLWSAVNR